MENSTNSLGDWIGYLWWLCLGIVIGLLAAAWGCSQAPTTVTPLVQTVRVEPRPEETYQFPWTAKQPLGSYWADRWIMCEPLMQGPGITLLGNPETYSCCMMDMDNDGDSDLADYAQFQVLDSQWRTGGN